MLAAGSLFGLSVGGNYEVEQVVSNVNDYSFTQYEGLSVSGGTLYYGNFREVKAFNLGTRTESIYGSLPGNNGISHVTYAGGQVYASHFTSYAQPYPYFFGSVSQGGSFNQQLQMDGIYDAAVAPNGNLYFVSNHDSNGDDLGDGSRIYQFDITTGLANEVAAIGGASGGLTFDAAGNLYYANFDADQLISFSASQVATGGLQLADANVVMTLENGGYLGFDSAGFLLASQLDDFLGSSINRYDLSTGTMVGTVATSDDGKQFHKFVTDGDTVYIIEQSWDWSGDYGSAIYGVTIVPEPQTIALWAGLLVGAVVWVRRRK